MEVEDGLASVFAVVHHEAVAFFPEAHLLGDLARGEHDLAEDRSVLARGIADTCKMHLGYDERVHRRDGMNVPEPDDVLVFEDDVGGDLAGDDFAEQAAHRTRAYGRIARRSPISGRWKRVEIDSLPSALWYGAGMSRYDLGDGRALSLEHARKKLSLRAGLPGAYLFDRASHALRQARGKNVSLEARVDLAFASSWLVNCPAPSPSLRALSQEPLYPLVIAIAETLEDLPDAIDPATETELSGAVNALSSALGDKAPQGAEVLSKILALVLPETVPLLPDPACRYLLGEPPKDPGVRFVRGLSVFRAATIALYTELVAIAKEHEENVLDAAQVLDRVLWFDSEGFRHFPTIE